VRLAAAILLSLLPGAWIAFGLRLPGFSFGARLLTAVALAPLILPLQLYAVRLAGVPFGPATIVLAAANLPALVLVARRLGRPRLDRHRAGDLLLLLLLCAASLAPQLADPQARAYTGHAWMYADAAYFSANGDLDLEEAELAGTRLAYPWAGLVFQGFLSHLAGSPPVLAYVWVNLLWLFVAGCLVAAVVSELGGGRLARTAGVVALFFGVNVVGYALLQAMRAARDGEVDIRFLFAQFGDGRFTPWLAKFLFLQQEPFAFTLFLALLLVLVRHWPGGLAGGPTALAGALLAGLGIVYPILFPAGCALVAARVVGDLSGEPGGRREAILLGAASVAAGAAAVAHLAFVSRDRVDPAAGLSDGWWTAAKLISAPIVLAPLLAGLAVAMPELWRARRRAAVVLAGGLAGSVVLHVILALGEWRNEYKFVFTAAACAAPFAGLAFGRLERRRLAPALLAATTAIVVLPLAYKFSRGWPLEGLGGPPVVADGFDLRLAPGERFAALTDAIREKTPAGTIVVLGDDPGIHLPTLTRRRLYVPPVQKKPHPGVGEKTEDILKIVKGYDTRILVDRRRVVADLFGGNGAGHRARALDRLLSLGSPVAVVVVDEARRAELVRWLDGEGRGRRIYAGYDGSVWLVAPGSASAGR
jgi:hypothetical protein